jgi:hypothetical protein
MLQQIQLISLIDKVLGQSARLRLGGTEAMYHCPFCNESKRIPKLEICLSGNKVQQWNCWICHTSGKSIRSLFKKLRVNSIHFAELYKIVGEYQFHPRILNEEKHQILALPDEFISLRNPSKSMEYGNAVSYLRSRGVTRCDILRYNIGYCEQGEYRKRILIPSYDNEGNLNFFAARAYYDNPMKYKLPSWSKDIVGFELFINWNEPITLVEGSFDGISVRRNAIPLFGTTISNRLRESIVKYGVWRVNIVLDNDALKSAVRIFDEIEKLKGYDVDVHLITLKEKDPSQLGFQKVNEIIERSKPFDFSDIIKMKMNL